MQRVRVIDEGSVTVHANQRGNPSRAFHRLRLPYSESLVLKTQEIPLSAVPKTGVPALSPCIIMVYDGNALAQQQLLNAEILARWPDAVFLLVAVMQEPASSAEQPAADAVFPEVEAAERAHRSFILERGADHLRSRGLRADAVAIEGSCVDEIIRMVKTEAASLLVIAHRPEASFSHQWWQAQVVRRLVERAPCGVLLLAPHRPSAA